MKPHFSSVLMHSLAFVVVGALAVAACTIPGVTDVVGETSCGTAFKCESPTLTRPTQGIECGPNCRCMNYPHIPARVTAGYFCVNPQGDFSLTGVFYEFLEELSVVAERTSTTCVSKLRCTR